ncbi:MAG: hypothetical protein ACNI27_06560 [Desulfovibrio sp.]
MKEAKESCGVMQTVHLYDGILDYPNPHWVESKDDLDKMQVYQSQTKNAFTLEIIPKSQSFESWTNLYGVYAYKLPDYDINRFILESKQALKLGCGGDAEFECIEADNGMIITFHCPQLGEPFVTHGRDSECGFLFIGQVGKTFVKVYQAWRGENEYIKTGHWLIKEELIDRVFSDMKKINLYSVN